MSLSSIWTVFAYNVSTKQGNRTQEFGDNVRMFRSSTIFIVSKILWNFHGSTLQYVIEIWQAKAVEIDNKIETAYQKQTFI